MESVEQIPEYHVFLSYARKDDRSPAPVTDRGEGWVTAFARSLKDRHRAFTGRELKVFFDTESIDEMRDWRAELGRGLRSSQIFLAFLSENYIRSENCRWEWLEYLRREHTLARGDDGIGAIYFVTVPNMPMANEDDPAGMAEMDAALREDQDIATWLDEISEDLLRRNLYLDSNASGNHPRAAFDLRSWYSHGPGILAEVDAEERIAALRVDPASDDRDLPGFADRLDRLDETIALRLDRCLLADLAPGNLGRSVARFVGRHRELVDLHRALTTERTGMLTAAHGLGGQGKTALAIQYAFAYAEFYASGGRWMIPCEGKTSLGEALTELAADPQLGFEIPEDVSVSPDQSARFVLAKLEQWMSANHDRLLARLEQSGERHHPTRLPYLAPRCLILLDNVDCPEILQPAQLQLLPESEWLEIVITTRKNPSEFGAGSRTIRPIEVDSLLLPDAVSLLREFQPGRRFASAEEQEAAEQVARALGGFALTIELVGAFLGEKAEGRTRGITFAKFLEHLTANGLTPSLDELAGVEPVGHRTELTENQISFILGETLADLSEEARYLLEHAAFFDPDFLVLDWLREILAEKFPDHVDPESARAGARETLLPLLGHLFGENPELIPTLLGILGDRSHADHESVRSEITRAIGLIDDADLCGKLNRALKHLAAPDQGATVTSIHDLEDPFEALWREISEARLLTRSPDEEFAIVEEDPVRRANALPRVVRLHRVIGDFLRNRIKKDTARESVVERCIAQIDHFTDSWEQGWQENPADNLWLLRPLAANATRLLRYRAASHRLAVACGIAGQAEMTIGQLARAENLILTMKRFATAALTEDPDNETLQRISSIASNQLGDFYRARGAAGDAELALMQFQQSLDTRKRLFDQNPNSAQAARDLSVSLNKLGDFFLARGAEGDAELALMQYQQCHSALQRLFDQNPNSAQAARDLSVSLNKLGEFYLARGAAGDAELALMQFQQSLDTRKRLFDQNPNSAQAARDLSVSFDRLGDFYRARGAAGDAELALMQFQQSLKIAQRLFDQNPNSAQAARDLSVSLNRLGDFYLARGAAGDAELALIQFQQSLEFDQRLFEQNPNSALAARDLSVSHFKLFHYFRGENDEPQAKENLIRCFMILDGFAKEGRPMDPQMRQLHGQLKPIFENDGSED